MKWPIVRLDAVGSIVTGGTPPTADRSNYGHEFMFVSPADLGATKYIRRSTKMLSPKGFARCRRIPSGSTLFVCIGSTIGKIGLAGEDLATNQQINSIIPGNRVDSEYLYYAAATLSRRVQNQAGEQAVPIVSKSRFAEFEIPLPALAEQRKIATALKNADDLVASLERLIAKKQAIKQGMMQELLSGKTRLPGCSQPWASRPLGELARIKTGSRNNQDKRANGRYPFFVRSAAVERIDSYSYDCEAILIPGEGGIGSIFHYIHGKFEVHQRVYKISDFAPDVLGRFVYHYMRQYFGRHAMENSVKATVDSLRLPTFRNFVLQLPDVDEQGKIATVLDDADRELEVLHARLAKARSIKQGMMQELLTGRTRLPVPEAVA